MFWLQYRSVDSKWYDDSSFTEKETAIAEYKLRMTGRPESKSLYQVVERTDKVVWPVAADPASFAGA
jgi:hypothetical protein